MSHSDKISQLLEVWQQLSPKQLDELEKLLFDSKSLFWGELSNSGFHKNGPWTKTPEGRIILMAFGLLWLLGRPHPLRQKQPDKVTLSAMLGVTLDAVYKNPPPKKEEALREWLRAKL